MANALSRSHDYEFAHVMTLSSSVTDLILTDYDKDEQGVALLRAIGSEEFRDSDIDLSARYVRG